MVEIRLRRASVDDLGEVITVQRAAFLVEAHAYGHPVLPPLLETIDEVRAVLEDPVVEVLVAEELRGRGPRIVAVARATPDHSRTEIGRVAVAPDRMGTGVGSALMQHLHDHPTAGTERFVLFTGGKSVGNHRWYAGHGYVEVRRLVDDHGIEVVMMSRPVLTPRPAIPDARAAAYVTRTVDSCRQLLVFDHADFPESGTQIPAGGMEAGESVLQAAVREVREETGAHAGFQELLGYVDSPNPDSGVPRRTAYVHLEAQGPTPDDWVHTVSGDGEDAALAFHCYWAATDVALADDQASFLSSLTQTDQARRQKATT